MINEYFTVNDYRLAYSINYITGERYEKQSINGKIVYMFKFNDKIRKCICDIKLLRNKYHK